MTTIKYNAPTDTQSLGRNGFIKTVGLMVCERSGEVVLEPLTSRGTNGRCKLVVPSAELGAAIAALQALKTTIDRREARLGWLRSAIQMDTTIRIGVPAVENLDDDGRVTIAVEMWTACSDEAKAALLADEYFGVRRAAQASAAAALSQTR